MIWIGITCLSLIALAPAFLGLFRRRASRDERSAALALHEAQLTEVDRDLAAGLIATPEHGVARLEIQRRILLADRSSAVITDRVGRIRIWLALAAIPLVGVGLYLASGHPNMAAQPLKPRLAAIAARDAKAEELAVKLRDSLARLPAYSPELRQGYLLLGQLEAARDHYAATADAWGHALTLGFDPELAAQTAEAHVRATGHIDAEALALYRRALDAAPKDAQWRTAVEQRIAQGEHEQEQP